MSPLDGELWPVFQQPVLSDEQIFENWVAFGGDWTLEEYTEAYFYVSWNVR